jgi:predicted  nucleic acid-binding Zn-ribbon protein
MSNEQIANIVTRFNLLEKEQENLSFDIISRDTTLYNLRQDILVEIDHIKEQINILEEEVEKLSNLKQEVIKSFKHIVKKEHFNQVENKVNRLDFENLMYRDELLRNIK